MNFGLHQLGQRIINHSVALNAASPLKFAGYNRYVKMPFAVLRACMAQMQLTLVFDHKFRRVELLFQFFSDKQWSILSHGNTFLNGFTVTRA